MWYLGHADFSLKYFFSYCCLVIYNWGFGVKENGYFNFETSEFKTFIVNDENNRSTNNCIGRSLECSILQVSGL